MRRPRDAYEDAVTDTAASAPARAGATSWLGKLEGKLSWILLGLAGLAAAVARRQLHRRHRPARLHLLGPVGRPEPRGRLCRPDRHRLGVDADARRLHHGGAGRGPRRGGVESLPRAGGGRRHGRHVRRHRRPSRAQAAHLLLRHDDAGLRHHRHPGGARLEGRHRRRRRHAGPDLPLAVRAGLGLLLFLLHPGGARDLDDGQHRLEPLRPRAGGDP